MAKGSPTVLAMAVCVASFPINTKLLSIECVTFCNEYSIWCCITIMSLSEGSNFHFSSKIHCKMLALLVEWAELVSVKGIILSLLKSINCNKEKRVGSWIKRSYLSFKEWALKWFWNHCWIVVPSCNGKEVSSVNFNWMIAFHPAQKSTDLKVVLTKFWIPSNE